MNAKFYKVKIKFVTPVLGTKPDKETFAKYLKTVGEEEGVEEEKLKDEEETIPTDEEIKAVEERGTTRFNREKDKGVFIYDYAIKGFLKNAGNILKDELKIAALKSKIQNVVFVGPRKVFLKDDNGNVMQGSDEIFARPKMVDGQHGKVSVIGVSELIRNANLEFMVMILSNKLKPKKEDKKKEVEEEKAKKAKKEKIEKDVIDENVLKEVLSYGIVHGIGQWRNGGYGSFQVLGFEEDKEMTFSKWGEFCYKDSCMDENVED